MREDTRPQTPPCRSFPLAGSPACMHTHREAPGTEGGVCVWGGVRKLKGARAVGGRGQGEKS